MNYYYNRKRIQDFLFSLGYVWIKHSKMHKYDMYVRENIAILLTYKMLKFYYYNIERKRPEEPIIQFSKNIDEHLWKKFVEDTINYPIEECIDRIIEEIEKSIEFNKSLQR